ncbi:MAG: Thivi_2564 family membrane protein [Pseudomonadota bacterium]
MPLTQLVVESLSALIVLVVVGVILWVINSFIPMQATIKKILNVVVIISVVIWLLSVFGIIGNISAIRIWK